MKFEMMFLASLLFISIDTFSQTGESFVTDVSKATLINPGVSYEKALGKKTTLYGQLFINTSGYYSYSSSFGEDYAIYFDPAVTVQYRYYYNALRRQSKDKRTELNSMNYLAAVADLVYSRRQVYSYAIRQRNHELLNKIGVAWGLQRNYNSRISLDLNLGLGVLFSNVSYYDYYGQTSSALEGDLTLLGQFNFGFWLNRRK